MNKESSILDALNELYNDNINILQKQNYDLLEKNSELNSLFKSFTLSNERLKNIINTIKILKL